MTGKTAFITGITGMDGSHLTDFLINKNYEVHGLIRQSTQFTQDKWGHLRAAMGTKKLYIHFGDLTDSSRLRNLIEEIKPNEVYNLAAQSHVGQSFEMPDNTCEVTGLGALKVLEAVRKSNLKDCRFYQASSSEIFGKVKEAPQSENTPLYPRSPYGCAKAFAHFCTQNYREAYGMFAVSGILFNHESERRGENFVTRKITRAIGRIIAGKQDHLELGNLSARRDWGYAPDYVEAMWLMLQQDVPQDFVIGTGITHSVQDFVETAFKTAGLKASEFIKHSEKLIRPAEVDYLCANNSKAQEILKWMPQTDFKQLVAKMVAHDIALAKSEDY